MNMLTIQQSKKGSLPKTRQVRPSRWLAMWVVASATALGFSLSFAQTTESPVDESQIIASDAEDKETEPQNTAHSTSSKSSAGIRAQLDQQQTSLLAQVQAGPESVWLTSETQFLAFWQDDLSGAPVGTVLLLHDSEQNPIWPETVLNLHRYLPLYGWSTLSIELLPLPQPHIPPRPISTTPPPAPESKADGTASSQDETQVVHQDSEAQAIASPPPPVAPLLAADEDSLSPEEALKDRIASNQQRIAKGIEFLNAKGQYNVVLLGIGYGAHQVLRFANANNLAPPQIPDSPKPANAGKKAIIDRAIRALIIVDMHNQYERMPDTSLELLQQPEIPLMDITTSAELDTRDQLALRQQVTKKNHYTLYRQRRLTPANGTLYDGSETELSKVIRGFLQRYAAGEQL